MRKISPKAMEYRNRYNSNSYDRMNIMVPKGKKQQIQKWAKEERGCKSTNAYISGLIQADMGQSDEEWQTV